MSLSRFITLNEVELKDKRVLIRVDFNVPITDGTIDDDTRIQASLPTIKQVMAAGGKPVIMSHLGRPVEGEFDPAFSLQPVADHLSQLLHQEVVLLRDWRNTDIKEMDNVVLLENIRFETGEKNNDEKLARELAAICDVYVNDAFATAHRAQSSTHGVAKYAPTSCAGPLLVREIEALGRALDKPEQPMLAIVGGAKVSTKLTVLENLMQKVNVLIVGGGIANTFLYADGYSIGQSLCETELVSQARKLLDLAEAKSRKILLPVDVVCATEFSKSATAMTKSIADIADNELILDVGPDTTDLYAQHLAHAKTIVWNGPLGVFEFEQFSAGTRSLALAIAQSSAFSIAGGGDTLSAIATFNVTDKISYISTGGGAFLELLEGKALPALEILQEVCNKQ